jgi:hypothetical protein
MFNFDVGNEDADGRLNRCSASGGLKDRFVDKADEDADEGVQQWFGSFSNGH